MIEFKHLDRITQAWTLSMVIAYQRDYHCRRLVKKYVDPHASVYFADTMRDRAMVVNCEAGSFMAFCGTKNLWGWLSNLNGFANRIGYHRGVYNAVREKIFLEMLNSIGPEGMVCGHSRGAAMALAANEYLCSLNKPCNSIGFNGLKFSNKKGAHHLELLGCDHTRVVVDSYKDMPGDPVDELGTLGGVEYGKQITLSGGSWLFSHSYKNSSSYLLQYFNVRGYHMDADFMSMLINDKVPKK